ncbi:MAG: histidinol phosphatase [Chitinophagaceae bacterium]|nr:histidinol phosphatase [Chitinophagaceae bacterium]
MFSIFKKKHKGNIDLSELGADMHSHLLPGIDDGSPDTNVSAELITGLKDLGYARLVTTPHIMSDMYRNNKDTISDAYDQLRSSFNGSEPAPMRFAAEYYLDDHVDELLQKNIPLLTIRDNWVLVEFSFITPPMDLKEKLFALQIKGYQPVLAHPERYTYLSTNKKMYDELKVAGCLFQLNLLSLTNYYGKPVNELAHYLVKKDYIDLLGTDLHHDRHLQALRSSPILTDHVRRLLDTGKLLNPTINF